MRSIALVALFVLAVGTGCASKRIVPTYETSASSYAAPRTYVSNARTPVYTPRDASRTPSRPVAPVYGTGRGRNVTYASAVPPPPPPPPLYAPRVNAPARQVVYAPRPAAPRGTVTPVRRAATTQRARSRTQGRSSAHKDCVSFVGGFAGILPPSSCST